MAEIFIEKGDCSWLGKKVTVKIDRPLGTAHPEHPDMIYPVNYGYAEGLTAGDGEGQDVYILSVNEPADEAEAVVIAVIERLDDNEDKWVAVPEKLLDTPICYECNINRAIEFQEKYYTHICHALYEKTCGAVMFTERDGRRLYLLIKNDSGHIGFPKGHVEYGETEYETAVREVIEETALEASPIDGFRMAYSYVNAAGHRKTAVYFLSHYGCTAAVIQKEEISDSWLLPYDEAIKLLNYPQDIPVLEGAEKFLNETRKQFT
ncbi:MAG: NUDIX domain-containing protein [Oscillospiraceae bacterium]|nr:NUDIX domain-containing protein [Oscillospiraceae bacterium]